MSDYDPYAGYETDESPFDNPNDSIATTEQTTDRPASSGRHPVNIGHLVMGVAFLGLASLWFLYDAEIVAGRDLRWFVSVPWLLAGVAGLVAVILNSRRQRRADRYY